MNLFIKHTYIIQTILIITGLLITSLLWGFETNYDEGKINFLGSVTDSSCSISLNSGKKTGVNNVWLDPISLTEIYNNKSGAYLKPKKFTLVLSNCQIYFKKNTKSNAIKKIEVKWTRGFTTSEISPIADGFLKNTKVDGASNIFLALSTNADTTLSDINKIIPGDIEQNEVSMIDTTYDGATFTYYVGYVTPIPNKVKTGKLFSWAVWEIMYN